MQKKLNSKKYIIIVIALILIAIGFYIIFKNFVGAGEVPTSNITPSITTMVREETYKETISASGTIYLEDEVSVYATEEGLTIASFLVEEGDYVEEGQAIVEYDIDDKKESLEKSIKSLETELKNQKLELESFLLPATESEKLALQNNVIQAEQNLITAQNNLNNYDINLEQKQQEVKDALITLETAQKTYEQNLALYEIGAVSEDTLTDSANSVDKAQVTYNNTVYNLEEFEKTKSSLELTVSSAENTLKQAQIALENADDPLSTEQAKISYQKMLNSIASIEDDLATYRQDLEDLPYYDYATTSGTVTSISVNEGSKTEDNVAMLKIADVNQLIIQASVSEYDVPSISVGQLVEMTSDGIEDKTYYGTITKIDATANSASTNLGSETVVGIEISLENGDELLKPGYTLDLEIVVLSQENTISINNNSVITDEKSGESYVFVVKDDKVVKTTVEVGYSTTVEVQIISGLKAGDEIITKASNEIVDGMTLDEVRAIVSTISTSNSSSSSSTNESRENMMGGAPTTSGSAPTGGGGGAPRGF